MTALNDIARERKDPGTIYGVRFFEDVSTSVR